MIPLLVACIAPTTGPPPVPLAQDQRFDAGLTGTAVPALSQVGGQAWMGVGLGPERRFLLTVQGSYGELGELDYAASGGIGLRRYFLDGLPLRLGAEVGVGLLYLSGTGFVVLQPRDQLAFWAAPRISAVPWVSVSPLSGVDAYVDWTLGATWLSPPLGASDSQLSLGAQATYAHGPYHVIAFASASVGLRF